MSKAPKKQRTLQVEHNDPSRVRRLSEPEKRAIAVAYAVNGRIDLTAQEFGVHRNTVTKVVKSVRDVKGSQLDQGWRERVKHAAVDGMLAGLNHNDDPYKRGELANKALIGLGEFKGNDLNVNVATVVGAMPEDVSNRYVSTLESTPIPLPVVVEGENHSHNTTVDTQVVDNT